MRVAKEDYIKYRISKSIEIFEDAVLLAQNDRWNSCVNRLYYSSYYLASALLYKDNINSKTHNGTKSQLFLNFIKSGKLDVQMGKLYSHLFDWRQETDYADFVEFDRITIEPIIHEVKELNNALIKLIQA